MNPATPDIQQQNDLTLQDAGLTVALANRLRRDGIHSLLSASLYTEAELLLLNGIGPLTVELIKACLGEHGLSLRTSDEPLLEKARLLYPNVKLMPLNVLLRSVAGIRLRDDPQASLPHTRRSRKVETNGTSRVASAERLSLLEEERE